MAYWKISNCELRGVAACVPRNTVNTSGMSVFTSDEAEKFIESVKIRQRRIAVGGICASDLCHEAAVRLIDELKWNKNEIDALIFVSITADYRSPATSCILQERLGLPNSCFTLDISLACCGYLHGITVLSNMMSMGNIRKALLLVGDTCSLMSSPEDKSRFPIFGDAGTASAFEYIQGCSPIFSLSYTNGAGYDAIITPHSGFRHPITPESFIMQEVGDGIRRAPVHAILDGLEVFSFAISCAPKVIKELMEKMNKDIQRDIDYVLLHQANWLINEKIRKKLKLSEEQVPSNLDNFGNTSCAALPLLMVTNLQKELRYSPQRLLLSAFGVGLTWGAISLETSGLVIPDLVEI